jgi:hypothetical protein
MMAQFTHTLCEEVIRTEGGCGLSRNEITQMAKLALRALKNENPYLVDAIRYRWLRDHADPDEGHPAIRTHDQNSWGKWYYTYDTGTAADAKIDAAMSGAGSEASQCAASSESKESK